MKPTEFVFFACQPAHRTIGKRERTGFLEQVTEPWSCKWHYRGNTRILSAEPLDVWDGASVPRFGWTIIGITPGGLADGPSLAHDILYRAEGGRREDKLAGCTLTDSHGLRIIVDREEADWLFRELCRFAGMKKARAVAAYGIVRAFGNTFWGGNAPSFNKG
jgi:hypothetical protein